MKEKTKLQILESKLEFNDWLIWVENGNMPKCYKDELEEALKEKKELDYYRDLEQDEWSILEEEEME